ncbi:vesicle transport protein SFT2B-like isoform X2 [Heterodontus francisci]|uniref:vesicle transport protein SFT2B-like isoform X2 n=1 Tax=Heterodontus francisci TaxID=7792 RepID=UPI00355BCDB9
MDKLKKVLNGSDSAEDGGPLSEVIEGTSLGWGTRVKGFLACFAAGIICSILGVCFLWIPKRGLILFAIFYSIGNISSIGSTLFLMGPVKQCKKMFEPTRLVATIVMLWKKAALALIFCVLQFFAMAWYSISYIPFARDAVIKCFSTCMA